MREIAWTIATFTGYRAVEQPSKATKTTMEAAVSSAIRVV